MKNSILIIVLTVVVFSCGKKSDLTKEQVEEYTEQGKTIAQASFEALSGQLKMAMKAGGIEQAVGFCNVAAYPLTDSLSRKYGAVIKRTSLKLRNPLNAPDSMEQKMLKIYLQMSRMRNPVMVPKILEKNKDEIQFFAPIMIQDEACLKCHGIIGGNLNETDYEIIKKHYPKDEAIDYKMGKFRGMWSITLKK